ncbi:glycosyltransferase [uncultured Chryseobacterium sp.]|uniref:glycosyltransferase n=1 Tax=uncultured Chryseobacterium sp. TaxID=259322 RepID=UPI0025FDF57C|nr:glycosyltransferase [uncultured Chryseobacterium sp.]
MTISVALCTYNGEKFLEEQINSILDQTIAVHEIVVCDDRSTDATLSILDNYLETYPEVFKIFRNDTTLKSVKNFEKAISLCTGDIIFLADQDDYWYKDKVETILNFFNHHRNINVICTNGHAIDNESRFLENHFVTWDVFLQFTNETSNFSLFDFLIQKGNFATGASMAFRKSIKDFILPIPEIKGFHHDEYIALVAASNDEIAFIGEKLINYRIHSSQQVGGIAYHHDKFDYQEILDYFKWNADNSVNDFKTLKRRIKSQIIWYNKYMPIYKEKISEKAFNRIKNGFLQRLNTNIAMMKSRHPVKYKILSTADKILNKRQLKN